MKEKLMKMIEAKKAEQKSIREKIKSSEDINEVRSLGETLDKIAEELKALEEMVAGADEGEAASEEGRKALNPMALYDVRSTGKTSNLEERKAFQKYMATGEKREATKTTDTNVGTVIPENLVKQIIEKFEQLGTIYNLVNHTAFPVGQAIPTDGIKPVATWVGKTAGNSGEGLGSAVQNKTLGALITFAHYKLRCEIALTEEVANMTLEAFEALFVKQVSEAMLRAKEFAIVEGDGIGMPTGILQETAPEGQAITVDTADGLTYEKLVECEAVIPVQYEGSAKWCMTKSTFMRFVGMVDSVGQPIARVNFGLNSKPERYLLGREVVLYAPQAGSKLKAYSAAGAGDLVAFIFNFDDYTLNSNYNLGISHKLDWDNEDHRTKAVEACDGKVIVKDSLVTVKIAG